MLKIDPMTENQRELEAHQDSDSHNIQESDTSAEDSREITKLKEEPPTFFGKIKKIFNWISRLKFHRIMFFIVFCLSVSIFTTKIQIDIVYDKNKNSSYFTLSGILIFIAACCIIFISLSITIFHISLFLINRLKEHNSVYFYMNELSKHISVGIIILSCIVYIITQDKNFYFVNNYNFDLFAGDFLNILLLTDFLLAVTKMTVKGISLTFNYSNYMDRIRKCILEEYLLKLLDVIKKKGNDARTIKKSSIWSEAFPWRRLGLDQNDEFANKVFDTFFKDTMTLESDLQRKRMVFKEFQKIIHKNSLYGEDPYKSTVKLRRFAHSKAKKLCQKLKNEFGIYQLRDLCKYFQSESMYRSFADSVNLKDHFQINEHEVTFLIERTHKERYCLKKSLEQMNVALERVGNAISLLFFVFALIMIFVKASINLETVVSVLSATFGTGFVFQSSVKNAVDSVIFLFCIHPFDIGDRVVIELENGPENMVVSELNVFSTVFYRWDGTIIYVPNSVLSEKSISNIRRSGVMAESHKIQIDCRTDPEKLNELKKNIEEFLKANPKSYTENYMLNYDMIEDSNKLHLKIYMQYKTNFQNYELFLDRRTRFIAFLNETLRKTGITYTPLTQKIQLTK